MGKSDLKNQEERTKGAELRLPNMPLDVEDYILEVQGEERRRCRCTRSKEFIVYALIREHREMTELKRP